MTHAAHTPRKDPSVLQGAVFLFVLAVLGILAGTVATIWMVIGSLFLFAAVFLLVVGLASRHQQQTYRR